MATAHATAAAPLYRLEWFDDSTSTWFLWRETSTVGALLDAHNDLSAAPPYGATEFRVVTIQTTTYV